MIKVLNMHSRCPHKVWILQKWYQHGSMQLSFCKVLICMQIISSPDFMLSFWFIVILCFSVDWLNYISCQLLWKPCGANTFSSISLFLSKLHKKYRSSGEYNWLTCETYVSLQWSRSRECNLCRTSDYYRCRGMYVVNALSRASWLRIMSSG